MCTINQIWEIKRSILDIMMDLDAADSRNKKTARKHEVPGLRGANQI